MEGIITFFKLSWVALLIIGGFALLLFTITEFFRRTGQKKKKDSTKIS